MSEVNDDIPINSTVKVKSTGQEGILQYVGNTEFKEGIWYGIRLFNEGEGKNNGSVNGIFYFDCPKNTGVFVLRKNIELIEKYSQQQMNVLSQFSPPLSPKSPKAYGYRTPSSPVYSNSRGTPTPTGHIKRESQSYPKSKRDSMISNSSSFRGNSKHESMLSSSSSLRGSSKPESTQSSISTRNLHETLMSNRNKRESIISNSSSLRSWNRTTSPDLDHIIQEEDTQLQQEYNYKMQMNEEIIPTMNLPPQKNVSTTHAEVMDQAEDIVDEQNKIIQELHRELAEKERQLREVQCIVDDAKSSSKRAEIARKQYEKAEEQIKQLKSENQQLKNEKTTIQDELNKNKEQLTKLLHDYEVLVNEFESFSKIAVNDEDESDNEDVDDESGTKNKTSKKLLKSVPTIKEVRELRERCKKAEDKLKEIEQNGTSNTTMYPATRALLEIKEKKIQSLEKQLSEMKLNEIKLSSPTTAVNSMSDSPLSTLSDLSTVVSNQEYQELRSKLINAEDTKSVLENRCFRLEKEIDNWKAKVTQQNFGMWMPRESSRTRLTTYKFSGI